MIKPTICVVATLLAAGLVASPADARRKRLPDAEPRPQHLGFREEVAAASRPERRSPETSRTAHSKGGLGPRPPQWCGWYMRSQRGGGPEYNLAANWRRYGSPASPQVGAIVVWPHHVGEITGRGANGQWIVRSGNDGHRVRERQRSIAGAILRM